MRTAVKLAIVIAIAYFAWTKLGPMVNKKFNQAKVEQSSCPAHAQRVVNDWNDRLSHFTSPPYDKFLWDSYTPDLEGQLGDIAHDCSCDQESCAKTREAMAMLREAIMTDMDTAVKENSAAPASDVPRKMQDIENMLDRAKELAAEGK